VECDTRSRRPFLVEDDQTCDESSYYFSPWSSREDSLSQTQKAENLADNLATQFQTVTDPSVPAVIEMVNVALRSYFMTPASEPKLTNPEEVQDAMRGLKFSKAPGPNGIPKRNLEHLPQRALSFWSRYSTRSSSPITTLHCGSTLD